MSKSTTPMSHRIFTLFMAVLFLGTGLVTGIIVIISAVSQNKANTAATASPTTSACPTPTPLATTPATPLEGTKLSGFTPTSSVPSLVTKDIKVGTGAEAASGDNVYVTYTGAVAATGTIFQSSLDSYSGPICLSLQDVIVGWQDGIPGMKVGGTRQIVIPGAQAYGANPPSGSGIPANAPLVFDITLYKVQQ
jgi:FKBP-type peptidyl-prolyl cis-trans isomerase FkpA